MLFSKIRRDKGGLYDAQRFLKHLDALLLQSEKGLLPAETEYKVLGFLIKVLEWVGKVEQDSE
jgi:hypothetical protein